MFETATTTAPASRRRRKTPDSPGSIPYGDLNALRNIPAYHVGAAHYYDITQAGARFGIRGGASGVIEVSMMKP